MNRCRHFLWERQCIKNTLEILKQYSPFLSAENVYENLYRALSEAYQNKENRVADALDALFRANQDIAEYVKEDILTKDCVAPVWRLYVQATPGEPLSLVAYVDMYDGRFSEPNMCVFDRDIATMGRWFFEKVMAGSRIVKDVEVFLLEGQVSQDLEKMPEGFQENIQCVRDICVQWQARYQKQSVPYVRKLVTHVIARLASAREECEKAFTSSGLVAMLRDVGCIQTIVEKYVFGGLGDTDTTLCADFSFFDIFHFEDMISTKKLLNAQGHYEAPDARLDAFLRYLYTKCLEGPDALNYADLKIWGAAFLPINLYNVCQKVLAENGCELSSEYEKLLESWLNELKTKYAQSNSNDVLQGVIRGLAVGDVRNEYVYMIGSCLSEMFPYLREKDGLIEVSCDPDNFEAGIVAKFSWANGQAIRVRY